MGRRTSIHYFNKTLTGIKHKRELIMPLTKAFLARAEARSIELAEIWYDNLSEEERKQIEGVVETTWAEHSEPSIKPLPFGICLATPAEIMAFGTSI